MSAIQAYTPALQYATPRLNTPLTDHDKGRGVFNSPTGSKSPTAQSTPALSFSSESYAKDSMYLEYTNKDGDSFKLSLEHIEYQKTLVSVSLNAESGATDGQWDALRKQIKDQLVSMKDEILKKFFEQMGQSYQQSSKVDGPGTSEEVEVAQVPEEWNAENTSQRIVDFATAFFSSFEGASKDFLEKIKAAISDGFGQARELMGDSLPKPVGKLVDNTFALVMSKLDSWALEQGISIDETLSTAA